KPERHLYEEVICILNGQGATEIWDDHGNKKLFEWGKWSLFAPPMNTSHRLVNGSREPVKFLAAPTRHSPLISIETKTLSSVAPRALRIGSMVKRIILTWERSVTSAV